jgi:hypothetical protein
MLTANAIFKTAKNRLWIGFMSRGGFRASKASPAGPFGNGSMKLKMICGMK